MAKHAFLTFDFSYDSDTKEGPDWVTDGTEEICTSCAVWTADAEEVLLGKADSRAHQGYLSAYGAKLEPGPAAVISESGNVLVGAAARRALLRRAKFC